MSAQQRKLHIHIDPATQGDVPALLRLMKGLAEYERLSQMVTATEAGLHAALFGQRPVAEAILARAEADAIGFAVFFPTFSTCTWSRNGAGAASAAGSSRTWRASPCRAATGR